MYLEQFEIENIKYFASKTLFDFVRPDGSIKKWNVILGENGTGKSTLLQAIALTLAGPEAIRLLLPRPEGWIPPTQRFGTISATVRLAGFELYGASKVEGRLAIEPIAQEPASSRTVHYTITGNQPYETTEGRYVDSPAIIETVDDDFKYLARTVYREQIDKSEGWLACGYGPFRRLSGGSEDPPPESKAARFFTLFHESAALDQRLKWLQSLYFQAQEEVPKGITTSERWLKIVKDTLEHKLFPEMIRLEINAKGVFFEFKKNNPISALHLSDGYRGMLALVLDLLHWSIRSYPIADKFLDIKGIVLIDEIDAHLHPSWQREVSFWLQDKFPNLQFIVTTHSPFIPPAADPGAIFKLEKIEPGADSVQVTQEVESVQGWRFEQILVSPLFNLTSTRDPESEAKMQTHAQLKAKIKAGQILTSAEEKELADTAHWLEENLSPPGDSSVEMEKYRTIQNQVKELLNTLNQSQTDAQN